MYTVTENGDCRRFRQSPFSATVAVFGASVQGWNCRRVGGFNLPPSKFSSLMLIIACYPLSTLAAYGQPSQLFF